IAFETRAVAHEREVPALLTGFAFVTLHARFADQFGLAPLGQGLDGAGHGLRHRNGLGNAGLGFESRAGTGYPGRDAVQARQLQLVLVSGPLAREAARHPGLGLELGSFADLLVFARADPGMAVLVWIDMRELFPIQIRDRELPEDVVEDRGGILDR